MKRNIHPSYQKIIVTCSCGNIINLYSTLKKNINIDICSNCHPFYTGMQKIINTKGRVYRFNKKFNI
ncbi:50S ribosomal protein L31 [Sodalis-like secondary symbiont of Drepanosiphum platanoidis]|uniref:50S ribosomal protein L31 n=1 Tax=Sodalis-like secondary symbiont of Drepanosiphum platanoidis TaxID=2994493 RepID=UPI003464111A